MCDARTCQWQGTTDDRAEAQRWCDEHPHATSIIEEDDDDV